MAPDIKARAKFETTLGQLRDRLRVLDVGQIVQDQLHDASTIQVKSNRVFGEGHETHKVEFALYIGRSTYDGMIVWACSDGSVFLDDVYPSARPRVVSSQS
jgi:hypothetical protein